MTVLRVDVVAVSVDPPDVSETLRRRLDLAVRFLSDEHGTLMDALHVRHRNAMHHASSPGGRATATVISSSRPPSFSTRRA